MIVLAERRFTLEEWSRMLGDPTKDKAYLETQLGGVVGQYLSWKGTEGRARPATMRGYEAPLAALCLLVRKPVGEVTVADLRTVRDTFVEGRHKTVTAAFRGCFRWLYEEGLIDENPAARLRSPKQPDVLVTGLFTNEEKSAIVTAQTDIVDRVGVLLFFRAGLRKSELRNLQVRDVNLVERYVIVRDGKGGKARTIPIRGAVVRALDELFLTDVVGLDRPPRLDDHLIPPWTSRHMNKRAPERPMSPRGAHEWWYRCLQRAGIVEHGVARGRKMHGSRHTYATDLGRANKWNMLAVQKNLGHASIKTTIDLYTHFAFEDQEAAVDLLPEIEETEV